MSHFIEYCKNPGCKTIVSQCRCPGRDKEIRYSKEPCAVCAAKEVTSTERQMVSIGSCSSDNNGNGFVNYALNFVGIQMNVDTISDNGFHLFGLPWWVWLIVLSALFYTQRKGGTE